jgi:hypothetical protein
VLAADEWFLQHGLTYFVPEERAAARSALRPRRILPFLLVVLLLASGAGGALAWAADQVSFAPATLLSLVLLAATWYALTALHARPIVGWALARTFGSLRTLLPMTTRALPMLLLFITFLFINTEVWQVTSAMKGGVIWGAVLFFGLAAAGFLVVRLDEELDQFDDDISVETFLDVTADTPLAPTARRLVDEGTDLQAEAEVTGLQKANLVLVLLVAQAVQVLLLAVAVFCFFVLFGVVAIEDSVITGWLGEGYPTYPWGPLVSQELARVSIFLAAFSGLYFTVYAVTDNNYRQQFFAKIMRELARVVGARICYRELRRTASETDSP